MNDPEHQDRYSRQTRFAPIGSDGQARISAGHAVVVGCGALGAAIAEQLARAGVGRLTLIDRDFVEASNLQRQALYTEDDAQQARPKAVAAARRLKDINSGIVITPVVADVRAGNVRELLRGADVVLDGTDTFQTRHLLNEACCAARVPWIYGACVGAYGCSVAIVPGRTPCLRCVQSELPAPGDTPTCDTVGIIAPAVQMVAAWQVAEALKVLSGHPEALRPDLWAADVWAGKFQRLDVSRWRDPTCAVCGDAPTFPLLSAPDDVAVTLCGRDAVQVTLPTAPDLNVLARTLGPALLLSNEYLVRWRDGERVATCFRDGRVIVQGVNDAAGARAVCARWLGG